jgi:hypothetical protein
MFVFIFVFCACNATSVDSDEHDAGADAGSAPAAQRDGGADASRTGSSDGGPGTTPTSCVPEADVTARHPFCAARCTWKSKCDGCEVPQTECVAKCDAELDPLVPKLRKAYLPAATRCLESLPCTAYDDKCVQDYKLADPSFPNIPEVQSCLAKQTECAGAFADDACYEIAVFIDSVRKSAAACLGKSCAEIGACLKAAHL